MRKVEPKKDDYMLGGDGPLKPAKSKPRYPTMRLPLDVIPEAKKWEVVKEGESGGPMYEITLQVRQIGLSQGRFDQNAEFEIRGIDTEEAETDESSESADEETKEEGQE